MFAELDSSLLKALEEAGFSEPTKVQAATFEPALEGQDLFVSAETGSGKTAAYLLPLFEHLLSREQGQTLALVLVPTRELAQQVLRQAKQLARFTDITLGHIGGGTDIKQQTALLERAPQFLVATPGRLMELLAREQLELDHVETLILDEADRLLDMGFHEEVMTIAEQCLARIQTQLYSATLLNKGLKGLANELLTEPEYIKLNQRTDPIEHIRQQIIFSDDLEHKLQLVQYLLSEENYRHAVIFCNSKEQADYCYKALAKFDLGLGILHGDCDQKQRNLMMSKLRRDQLHSLVTTDILARGLDIEGMDLVINLEMPRKAESYLHRIGRTGRAGESGVAISLISAPEFNLMAGIERYLNQRFERRRIAELEGHYKGPKKLKSSGKAAGSKKKKLAKKRKTTGKRK